LPFLVFLACLVFPQQFLDGACIAFFSRPEVPNVGQAPGDEIRFLFDCADATVSQLNHPLREFIQF
jgi:hypothetical protein